MNLGEVSVEVTYFPRLAIAVAAQQPAFGATATNSL